MEKTLGMPDERPIEPAHKAGLCSNYQAQNQDSLTMLITEATPVVLPLLLNRPFWEGCPSSSDTKQGRVLEGLLHIFGHLQQGNRSVCVKKGATAPPFSSMLRKTRIWARSSSFLGLSTGITVSSCQIHQSSNENVSMPSQKVRRNLAQTQEFPHGFF